MNLVSDGGQVSEKYILNWESKQTTNKPIPPILHLYDCPFIVSGLWISTNLHVSLNST